MINLKYTHTIIITCEGYIMRRRFSWRSIWGSILISVGLVMILTFIWLVDLIGWRWLDGGQQIALFMNLVVACIFIVIGIRFSIIGLIEELYLHSPFLPSPYMMPKNVLAQYNQKFRECTYCKRWIPFDSKFCQYCGVKLKKISFKSL
jgi:MFS family permease